MIAAIAYQMLLLPSLFMEKKKNILSHLFDVSLENVRSRGHRGERTDSIDDAAHIGCAYLSPAVAACQGGSVF